MRQTIERAQLARVVNRPSATSLALFLILRSDNRAILLSQNEVGGQREIVVMPGRHVGHVVAALTVFLAGCSAGVRGRLMTWHEYQQIYHVVPYVLDISCDKGRLVYVGSNHTNDVTSLSSAVIESLWSQVNPQLAFNEGGDPPTEASKEEAVRLYGEAGFVRFLAARDGVPVASLDPTRAQLAAVLNPTFGAELVKMSFLLSQVRHHRANPTEPFEQRMARTFSILNRTPGLEGPPRSLAELSQLFESRFPGAESFREVPASWLDPVKSLNVMNELSRRSNEERDRHMVRLLVDHVRQGRRVFAAVGATHVVMQEAALRAALR